MRTIDDELKFNKGSKHMGKEKNMFGPNTGNGIVKVAKAGAKVAVGLTLLGVAAGAVKGAFSK